MTERVVAFFEFVDIDDEKRARVFWDVDFVGDHLRDGLFVEQIGESVVLFWERRFLHHALVCCNERDIACFFARAERRCFDADAFFVSI